MMRRKKNGYFTTIPGAPDPLVVRVERRVHFSEADVMGIAWHGRYPVFFEEAAAALGRGCGLSYQEFYEADLRAPIVQFHIDYHQPLFLDEPFTAVARMIWGEGARINTEYALLKKDGRIAAAGYSIQMFTEGATGEVCLAEPELLAVCRARWKRGDFRCLR